MVGEGGKGMIPRTSSASRVIQMLGIHSIDGGE